MRTEFLIRRLLWITMHLMYRVRVTGRENIPEEGGALLICNHVSFVDWLIVAGVAKRMPRFVMDYAFFKGFFVRAVLTRAKVIPIASAREDQSLLDEAFRRIAEELRQGALVCIFPEGLITRDGKLHEFKPGVRRVLADVPVPVVPMALVGLWGSFFSREGGHAIRKWPKRLRGRIELRIGPPISPEGLRLETLKQKVAELRGNGEP